MKCRSYSCILLLLLLRLQRAHGEINAFKIEGQVFNGAAAAYINTTFDVWRFVQQLADLHEVIDHFASLARSKVKDAQNQTSDSDLRHEVNIRTLRLRRLLVAPEVTLHRLCSRATCSFPKLSHRTNDTSFLTDWHKNKNFQRNIRSRHSRSPTGLLGLGLAAAALGLAVWDKAEVERIKSIIKGDQKILDMIVHNLHQEDQVVQVLARQIEVVKNAVISNLRFAASQRFLIRVDNAVAEVRKDIDEFLATVSQVDEVVNQAMMGRFSPLLVDIPAAEAVLASISHQAKAFGLSLKDNSSASLHRSPVSVYANAGIYHLVIHLPLVGEPLELLRHIDVPFPVAHTQQNLSASLHLRGPTYLAVATNDKVLELDDSRLAACDQSGRTYVCPQTIKWADAADTCLGALHDGANDRAAKKCHFQVLKNYITADRVNETTFLVITSEQEVVHVRCKNKTESYVIHGEEFFDVPNGCVISGPGFSYQQRPAEGARVDIVYRPLLRNLAAEAISYHFNVSTDQWLEKLENLQVPDKVDFSELRSAVAERHLQIQSDHTFLAVVLISLVIIGIIIGGVVFYKMKGRQRRRRHRQSEHPRRQVRRMSTTSEEPPAQFGGSLRSRFSSEDAPNESTPRKPEKPRRRRLFWQSRGSTSADNLEMAEARYHPGIDEVTFSLPASAAAVLSEQCARAALLLPAAPAVRSDADSGLSASPPSQEAKKEESTCAAEGKASVLPKPSVVLPPREQRGLQPSSSTAQMSPATIADVHRIPEEVLLARNSPEDGRATRTGTQERNVLQQQLELMNQIHHQLQLQATVHPALLNQTPKRGYDFPDL